MSGRRFLFSFLSIAYIAIRSVWAQEAVVSPGVRFEQYFSSQGLPDNRVRNIFQDSKGYLWVGTMNGLCRFDGYTFKKFYSNHATSTITTSWAHAIAEDEKGNLFIGTKYGLSKFDRSTEQFIDLGKRGGNSPLSTQVPISSLLYLDKKLWIGTSKGLLEYNPGNNQIRTFSNYPLKGGIAKLLPSWGNCLWLACDSGIVRFNTKTSKAQLFKINIKPNPYGDRVWSLLEADKSLFVGTGADGIIKLEFDAMQNKFTGYKRLEDEVGNGSLLKGLQVFDVALWQQNDLWLGTEEGLGRIKNLNRKPVLELFRNNALDKNSISNNIVYRALIDRSGVLWCGTELGLNKSDLNLLAFQYYTFRGINSADQVRSIASADGTHVFLGTASSGLYQYNTNTQRSARLKFGPGQFSLNAYRSLYVNNGELWAGTLGGSLRISVADVQNYTAGINNQATFATLRDSRDNLWIGTNKGLLLIDPSGKKVDLSRDRRVPEIIKRGFVRQIYEDAKGNLWLGFENGGLLYFNPRTRKHFHFNKTSQKQRLLGSNVVAITEYPANVIWAGTEAGLNKIDLGRNKSAAYDIKTFTEKDGLPDKSINGIIADDSGILWISTIKGLARFDLGREAFQTYLSNVNFSIGSSYKVSPHEFLFGTSNGFIAFDPSQIPNSGDAPLVALSELKLFNQPVEIGQVFNDDIILNESFSSIPEIKLNYHNNVFTLGFTALHYSNPEQNRYSYKMEGFDKTWINADASARTATYTNLDAGTYYFKVKAANYMNNWSKKPAVLKVTVLPPPWKTWWAIVLYVILFNILLYVLIRYVLIQSRHRQEIEYQKMEKEQLKRLNEMKVDFFTNISHEFRTPLTLISAPVEELLANQTLGSQEKQKVSFIYRNCKKLLLLLDELMTFQKAEQGMLKLKLVPLELSGFLKAIFVNFQPLAERNQIEFSLLNQLGERILPFDPDKLEMVLNNLISNSFKFTPEGGKIQLILSGLSSAESDQEEVSVTIRDNGKGVSEEELPHIFERFYSEHNKKGTGVGLALTKNLVELHGGKIEVESSPGKGTSFTVRLPYRKDVTPIISANDLYFAESPVLVFDSSLADGISTVPNKDEKPKLLIVEDNKEILDYLTLLFDSNYQVRRAINGNDALEKLKDEEPDLIISDLMMPQMTGMELCRLLKSDLKTSHIPFILLTAKSTDEDKLQGLQTGADDYISKPFHPEILKVKAEKLLESQRRLIEKYKGDGVVIPKDIAKNPLDEQFLQKVLDTINANLSNEEFSVEDLGEAVFMSRSHLFRKLKAITGQTPIELIYQVRIKHSMELLLQRKLSISEIAYEVGFKNPSSFTSSFKKQYGKSPKEYLNDVLKEQKPD
ncbi:ATP-binding protein [Desertivirga arenae]|uniref:ATP-binding protein n=1 Tax=Desertivirga arenae TaxID=2810309 RepID=UPI001A979A67|nr:ATP-binding protein [Pedobacter sp. SYSU D00823]